MTHLIPDDREEGAVGGRGGRADAWFCHRFFDGLTKKSKEEEPRAGPDAR